MSLRNIYSLFFLAPLIFFSPACKKKEQILPPTTQIEKIAEAPVPTIEEAASSISKVLCARVEECMQKEKAMTKDVCIQMTTASLKELMETKKITMTGTELNGCLDGIKNGTCEVVMSSSTPPTGCDKLK